MNIYIHLSIYLSIVDHEKIPFSLPFSLSVYLFFVGSTRSWVNANRWIERKRANKRRKTETLWKKTNEQKKNQVVDYRNKEPEHVKQIKLLTKKEHSTQPFLNAKEKAAYMYICVCVLVKCVLFTRIPLRERKEHAKKCFSEERRKKK